MSGGGYSCPECGWFGNGQGAMGHEHDGITTARNVPLVCDGWCDGAGDVAMIDQDGFAYCEPCGLRRRQYQPCRKLRPNEVRTLESGSPLARY